jgi:divalent metal cation (Fe/Co/Zn/Cd) transporter
MAVHSKERYARAGTEFHWGHQRVETVGALLLLLLVVVASFSLSFFHDFF